MGPHPRDRPPARPTRRAEMCAPVLPYNTMSQNPTFVRRTQMNEALTSVGRRPSACTSTAGRPGTAERLQDIGAGFPWFKRRRRLALVHLILLVLRAITASAQDTDRPKLSEPPQQSELDLINPDRPGLADGSVALERGRCQIETGVQNEFRTSGGAHQRTYLVPTLFRLGLGARVEARFEGNILALTSTSAPDNHVANQFRWTPVSFGMKFQFLDATQRRPSMGVIARFFPASGTDDLRTDHNTGDVRLAADWPVGSRFSLNPNVGVALSEDDGRTFTAALFALTLNYVNARKILNPFLDAGFATPEGAAAAGGALILDAGIAYLPTPNLQLDVSAGTGTRGQTPPDLFWSAGVSLRLGCSGHSRSALREFPLSTRMRNTALSPDH